MSQPNLSTVDYTSAPADLPRSAPAEPRRGTLGRFRSFCAAHRLELSVAVAIFILGVTLRLMPRALPQQQTVDEHLYIINVTMLQKVGVLEYPAIVQDYVRVQSKMAEVMLPPTRCMFVTCAYVWSSLFHTDAKTSLRSVAALFSILAFVLAGVCAARMGGKARGLAVFALMAVAPVEVQMAHRELVDGFFAFWALLSFWLLWENLQHPRRGGCLLAYAAAIAGMVMTKENAFFAFVGLAGILALAPKLKLGTVTRETVLATFAGAAVGVAILVFFVAGGVGMFIETYRLLVTKAEQMTFAYDTGGGPWYRYLVDLLLMSPAVLLPAIGAAFNVRRDNKPAIFLLLFVAFSYAVMTNVRNGMNLRYATMWDMPLRYLAVTQLFQISACVRRAPRLAAVVLVAAVGLLELRNYYTFFVLHDFGELITVYLMRALEIIRQ